MKTARTKFSAVRAVRRFYTLKRCPQFWHTASLWVLVLVFVLVMAGIMSIRPQVHIASKIQQAQPKQPLCFVLVSVTACIFTLLLPHFLQII